MKFDALSLKCTSSDLLEIYIIYVYIYICNIYKYIYIYIYILIGSAIIHLFSTEVTLPNVPYVKEITKSG